tara:strand:+ start:282 stop:545 length:264 start_codon:yes stop_codon:yes gene_type:complete
MFMTTTAAMEVPRENTIKQRSGPPGIVFGNMSAASFVLGPQKEQIKGLIPSAVSTPPISLQTSESPEFKALARNYHVNWPRNFRQGA